MGMGPTVTSPSHSIGTKDERQRTRVTVSPTVVFIQNRQAYQLWYIVVIDIPSFLDASRIFLVEWDIGDDPLPVAQVLDAPPDPTAPVEMPGDAEPQEPQTASAPLASLHLQTKGDTSSIMPYQFWSHTPSFTHRHTRRLTHWCRSKLYVHYPWYRQSMLLSSGRLCRAVGIIEGLEYY